MPTFPLRTPTPPTYPQPRIPFFFLPGSNLRAEYDMAPTHAIPTSQRTCISVSVAVLSQNAVFICMSFDHFGKRNPADSFATSLTQPCAPSLTVSSGGSRVPGAHAHGACAPGTHAHQPRTLIEHTRAPGTRTGHAHSSAAHAHRPCALRTGLLCAGASAGDPGWQGGEAGWIGVSASLVTATKARTVPASGWEASPGGQGQTRVGTEAPARSQGRR